MNTQDLVVRLEAISEELGDLAILRLQEALQGSDEGAADDEKRLAKARRAVDKAIAVLAGFPDSDA